MTITPERQADLAVNVQNGSIKSLSSASKDELINKLKKIEEELKYSKQICRTILNSMPISISLIDARNFKIIEVNDNFTNHAGLKREKIIGNFCYEIIHHQSIRCDAFKHICPIQQTLKTGRPSIIEHQHEHEEGNYVDLEVSTFPIKSPKGEIVQILYMAQDITESKKTGEQLKKKQESLEEHVRARTIELVEANEQLKQEIAERKRIEKELRKSEERFRTVADFAYDWEIWLGMDGNFIYVSPSCERITGYKAQEFIENPTLFLSIVHPIDQHSFRLHLDNIEKSPNIYHLDFRIIRRDGQERWISHYCQPVYNVDGKRLGYRSSNRDITDRKKAEDKIIEYQEQLRFLTSELLLSEARERRQLSVDLHDGIGQTLAMCQINTQKLQQSANSETVRKCADQIIKLIEMAISDTRTLTFNLSPPSLYELGLEAALDELAEKIQQEYGLLITLQDDGRLKRINLNTQISLYRAVRELIFNVVKHAQAREMKITISENDSRLLISVKDDGIGFDTGKIDFDLAESRAFGFFSVRERLKSLGGRVEIRSKPGHGTLVTLAVPLK